MLKPPDWSRRTKSLQILNTPQRRLPICDRGVKIVLLALMIDTEPLKSQISPWTKMRLHGPWQEDWALHAQLLHPILHHAQFQGNHSSNLDRATERDLAVALREVQIADAELCAWDVDRELGLAPPTEGLDVAISAVLRATGNSSSALFADFGLDVVGCTACMHILRLRRLGDDAT